MTHSNVISSVGNDNTWKSWGVSERISVPLLPEPGYIIGVSESESSKDSGMVYGAQLIGYYSKFDAPVMSVVSSSYHPYCVYTVSALGTVCAHTVGHKIFNAILEHKYEQKEERALEIAVQNRDLNEAFEILVKYSRNNFAPIPAKLEYEKELINFCKLKPAIEKSSWKISDSQPIDKVEIKFDISELGYGFPPGFGVFSQWLNLVPTELAKKYDLVLLRNEIVAYTLNEDLEKLMSKSAAITAGLKFDSEFMDLHSMLMIFKFILSRNFSAGLQFGLLAGQALAEATTSSFDLYADVFHYMIYPTAFDYTTEHIVEDPLSVTDAIRQNIIMSIRAKTEVKGQLCSILKATGPAREIDSNPLQEMLEDAKILIPMISLELRLMKVLHTPDVQEDIIKAFQSVLTDTAFTGFRSKAVIPFERTVSCFANKLYLGALLDSKQFDEYFGVATIFVIVSHFKVELLWI